MWDYQNHQVFSGNRRRIEVGNVLSLAQTEGIALKSTNKGYINSEKVTSVITIAPKLFEFDFSQFVEPIAAVNPLEHLVPFQLITHAHEGYNELIVSKAVKYCVLQDLQGRTIQLETTNKFITYLHGYVLLTIDGITNLIYLP